MQRHLTALLCTILPTLVLPPAISAADATAAASASRWTPERAWAWYRSQPWLVGCNFLPSTAVNVVEMWQKESFDAKTIDRELGWAHDLGFNTVRVFVNYAVWEADAAGLKDTFRQFLKLADQHGISTLVILFDDCFKPEPRVGSQPDPEPGVHNSQWVQSPGVKRRGDRAAWPKLEQYVKDMVGAFASDPRVLAWELYNEPSASLPLVEAAFKWAREARPSQPVTTTIFGNAEMQQRIIELSDVLCFHDYGPLSGVKGQVASLSAHGRPVLCTEWMARGAGSRFETHLPLFKENKIACWNWGLVAGRTQTYFPWGSPKGSPEPKLWHHDILRADGTPFNAREVQFIKVMTGKLPASMLPEERVLVPTAKKDPVPWRYTMTKPAADWFRTDFNDTAWKSGAAPFGREELPIARRPNTVWASSDLWLRREFKMPVGKLAGLTLLLHHDEDTEIYLNGVLAVKASAYNAAYDLFDITPEARATLKPGKNVMAAHCHQTVGGQYFDVGLVERVGGDGPAPPTPRSETKPTPGVKLPGLRKLMETPLRDTSICRGPDGTWYLTGTVEPFWDYNEGIKVWKSPDLTNWTALGFVWKYGASPWHKPYLEKKKPLWAPEIHFLKGTFWLTYSIPGWDGTGKTSGCGLLKSTSGKPEGPYEDMQPNERLGDEIDASLFQDDDGTVYFLWHSGKIAKMKPDLNGLAEPYRWLKTTPADPDPKHHSGLCAGIFGKGSFDHVGYEGMFLFKANGRYHFCCGENFSGRYSCAISTSTNLFGPYGERYEAIPHGGHNMFFQDERQQWWSTYFGSDGSAPWQERPGVLPVEFGPQGRVQPLNNRRP